MNLALVAVAGCGRSAPTAAPVSGSPVPVGTNTAAPTAAPTPLPSATPEALAALVNGEAITLAAYEEEVERCRAGKSAAGFDPGDCPAAVLDSLIEQKVMEQVAVQMGLTVTEADVDAALAGLEGELGGPAALEAWLTAQHYTPEAFRDELRRERLRALAAEQATAGVGTVAEQVHARAILVAAEDTARAVQAELAAGADFATLALEYSRDLSSRVAGGDLGWFPRGVLTVPEVEEAAFALQPGEISDVIASPLGFHLVQTLERDPARALSPGAAQQLREAAFTAWLDNLLAGAAIVRYVSPSAR